jgi:protein tyrosine phosphatase
MFMPSPSKAKGSSFEREVATFLSKLYNESFIRAPGSGAYVGGKNQTRKEFLHEGQIKALKGDIVPGESFVKFNCECKSYADFPFHLLYTGECKVLEGWLKQMMDVAEQDDVNVLFMKFNRKGKFVAVQSSLTWGADNFTYYSSKSHGDWIIIEFEHFFKLNRDLLKSYSSGISTDTMSRTIQHKSTETISRTI